VTNPGGDAGDKAPFGPGYRASLALILFSALPDPIYGRTGR
jgi:hypothetical protein